MTGFKDLHAHMLQLQQKHVIIIIKMSLWNQESTTVIESTRLRLVEGWCAAITLPQPLQASHFLSSNNNVKYMSAHVITKHDQQGPYASPWSIDTSSSKKSQPVCKPSFCLKGWNPWKDTSWTPLPWPQWLDGDALTLSTHRWIHG